MKSKKSKLQSKADKLWFLHNLKDKCEVCGKKAIQVHHFFPKGRFGHLRYEDDNAISICMGCHFNHHHAGDPTIHQTIIKKRGQDWYNNLEAKAKQNPKSFKTIKYYEDIINKLK